MMATRIWLCFAICSALLSQACSPSGTPEVTGGPQSAQEIMVRVAKRMQACWFARKDPRFRPYKLAAEINSYAGKPRVLIVPAKRPTALPKLVVQAQTVKGRPSVTAFGPMLEGKNGAKIRADVDRWVRGEQACV